MQITIHYTRETLYRPTAPHHKLQDRTQYTCTVDGTRFASTNKAELVSLLKRRYGRDIEITLTAAALA